jgi:hypothetical protein
LMPRRASATCAVAGAATDSELSVVRQRRLISRSGQWRHSVRPTVALGTYRFVACACALAIRAPTAARIASLTCPQRADTAARSGGVVWSACASRSSSAGARVLWSHEQGWVRTRWVRQHAWRSAA